MFKTVGEWLKKMDLTFAYNEEKRTFILPYEIDGNKFMVAVLVYPEKWIKIAAMIVEKEKAPKEMYLALLQENWNLFEVTYSVDQEGNVFSENDVTHETNFENFASEFQAVVYGVKNFFERIAPNFRIGAEGTYDRNSSTWV
ncbi:MAG: hypothetical protein ACTSSG_06630 [Candidatus Heimdallarchaeaceae archaeon]